MKDKHSDYLNPAKTVLVWLLIALILGILIGKRHQNTGYFNWRSELWADQAGYYVYLPALFVYNFDATSFPEKITEKTGDGFSLEANKVITRYTCGVAILQAPFFLIIHLVAGLIGQAQDGFSGIYHQVPNWAALFYAVFGLLFLWKFLLYYFKNSIAFVIITALFFGTNLYYYAVDNTGMSHIYSFALFALIAWLTKRMVLADLKKNNLFFFGWALVFALIVLIRPTNILVFPFLFFLDCKTGRDFGERLVYFFTYRFAAILLVAIAVVFLPQFLYWKYSTGDFLTDSYAGYGFSNLFSPKVVELWFSTNNGLFLYSPLYLAAIWGMYIMVKQKIANGWVIASTFALITYIFASWFIFSFGCGFGSRNYVEYLVLLALPFGFFLEWAFKLRAFRKFVVLAIVAGMVLFNQKLIYSYNKCFQGGDWDLREYAYLLRNTKFNKSLKLGESAHLGPENEYSKGIALHVDKIALVNFRRAIVQSEVTPEMANSEALLVLSIENPDSTIYWNSVKVGDFCRDDKPCTNLTVKGDFWLPLHYPINNSTISAYIWNKNKETLTVSSLDVHLE